MLAKNFMVPYERLITCREDETVIGAIDYMTFNDVGSIIIINNQNDAVGIVTSHDIFKAISTKKEKAFNLLLKDIMSGHLIFVMETDPLNNCIEKMDKARTHHLIVKDSSGKISGVLSSYDIVKQKALDIKAHPWIRKSN